MSWSSAVALDAMGGDHAPQVPVEAAVQSARNGIHVALVGDEPTLRPLIRRYGGSDLTTLRVHHAPDVIGMDESPSAAVRKKKGSSIRIAAELVASEEAGTLISAGNSGAVMAAGLFAMKRINGVQRPAIASAWPTEGGPVVALDLGANIEPSAVQLAQFGVMGACYAEVHLGRARPKVAVLSNGSEESKGTPTTKEAFDLLARAEGIEFVGYAEGRDVFSGGLDVVVTDGFSGNLLLKTLEGFVTSVSRVIEREVKNNLRASLGALLMKPALRRVKKKFDYEEAGAAPLLGLGGRCLIAHGGSNPRALINAIVAADRLANEDLIRTIDRTIARHGELGLWPVRARNNPQELEA